jgi:hypothetical protein
MAATTETIHGMMGAASWDNKGLRHRLASARLENRSVDIDLQRMVLVKDEEARVPRAHRRRVRRARAAHTAIRRPVLLPVRLPPALR